jgi:hypothetical protein
MSTIMYVAMLLGVLIGLGLFLNAYLRGQQVIKKLSQKKIHQ